MKTYKATIRTEVEMTPQQYALHIRERQEIYIRLIKDQDAKLARAKKSWSKKVDEYEAEIDKLESELKAM